MNCGVLRPGSWTMHTRTLLRSAASSVITASSPNPFTAGASAPQYAACSGMDRNAIAEPTLTTTPRSRGRMRARAARVPWTCP